ncbi:MAG: hypothetical protein FWC71_10630 [Defluviitaleaceae bacterium]|nr:hypothetical protein [Defluviitaleaceae bacterium]
MEYPVAEMFANGTYIKPIVKKKEFYKGGMFALERRFHRAVAPFVGAYEEFQVRTEGMANYNIIGVMWDYVALDD